MEAIPDQSLHFGLPFVRKAFATDADLPANTLTFSIDQGPAGFIIDPTTGLTSWTPTRPQVGTYPVTIRVTDNGVPPLTATATFQVAVTGPLGLPDFLHRPGYCRWPRLLYSSSFR